MKIKFIAAVALSLDAEIFLSYLDWQTRLSLVLCGTLRTVKCIASLLPVHSFTALTNCSVFPSTRHVTSVAWTAVGGGAPHFGPAAVRPQGQSRAPLPDADAVQTDLCLHQCSALQPAALEAGVLFLFKR